VLLLLINLAAGSIAATIYAIWAVRWAQRRQAALALLNAAVALTALVFAIGYGFILAQADHAVAVQTTAFRPLASLVLLLPAVARFLELRRDEQREAFARRLRQELS
jgi:hypothetical protein